MWHIACWLSTLNHHVLQCFEDSSLNALGRLYLNVHDVLAQLGGNANSGWEITSALTSSRLYSCVITSHCLWMQMGQFHRDAQSNPNYFRVFITRRNAQRGTNWQVCSLLHDFHKENTQQCEPSLENLSHRIKMSFIPPCLPISFPWHFSTNSLQGHIRGMLQWKNWRRPEK